MWLSLKSKTDSGTRNSAGEFDEVDAALDETNVGRLADLLHSLSKETQFLLVTHSKRMMHAADMIYGVTMQEPGVSKVVSVKLGGHEQQRATA